MPSFWAAPLSSRRSCGRRGCCGGSGPAKAWTGWSWNRKKTHKALLRESDQEHNFVGWKLPVPWVNGTVLNSCKNFISKKSNAQIWLQSSFQGLLTRPKNVEIKAKWGTMRIPKVSNNNPQGILKQLFYVLWRRAFRSMQKLSVCIYSRDGDSRFGGPIGLLHAIFAS